ncbi:TGFA factor, partial [Polyodon spathula]|nr:TGFA factor [Polyodon spathula]
MYCRAGDALFLLFGVLFPPMGYQEAHSKLKCKIQAKNQKTCNGREEEPKIIPRASEAIAVHSHFEDCPDSHSQFCLQGACRFLVQEKMPACVCFPGFMGSRCEHADLLAVVAADHKQQPITSVLVGGVVGSVLLILLCVLLHCCEKRGPCVCGRPLSCRHEKPDSLLKGRACCHPETGPGTFLSPCRDGSSNEGGVPISMFSVSNPTRDHLSPMLHNRSSS